MSGFNVRESFLTITELRHALSGLSKRYRRQEDEAGDAILVDVITEHGKPIAALVPYEAYTRVRELLLLVKAQADIAAGRVIGFEAGTSAQDAVDALLERGAKANRAGELHRRPAAAT